MDLTVGTSKVDMALAEVAVVTPVAIGTDGEDTAVVATAGIA